MTQCLLSLWLFFGCVELAEYLRLVPEASEANPATPDMDQEALSQLASGLKSDVPSLTSPGCAALATVATFPCSFLGTGPQQTRLKGHSPPSLRLHQHISVYRI